MATYQAFSTLGAWFSSTTGFGHYPSTRSPSLTTHPAPLHPHRLNHHCPARDRGPPAAQDEEDGGISDRPDDMADVYHTFFGIAALALLGRPGLAAIDPTWALPVEVVQRVKARNEAVAAAKAQRQRQGGREPVGEAGEGGEGGAAGAEVETGTGGGATKVGTPEEGASA